MTLSWVEQVCLKMFIFPTVCPAQESPSSWLDSAIPHLSEIILLEDTPSIQMEVGILVREFPDMR